MEERRTTNVERKTDASPLIIVFYFDGFFAKNQARRAVLADFFLIFSILRVFCSSLGVEMLTWAFCKRREAKRASA
jgi:hypothetical protein